MPNLFASLISLSDSYPQTNLHSGLRSAATAPLTAQTMVPGRRFMHTVKVNSTLPNGVISYYSFEGSAIDTLGTNNGSSSNMLFGSAGILGQGATPSTNTGYVDLGVSGSLNLATISISAWVNLTGSGAYTFVCARTVGTGISSSCYELRLNNSNQMEWLGTGGVGLIVTTPVVTGIWNHIVATRTGLTYTLYLNGAFANTTSGPAADSLPSNHTYIGAREDGLPHSFGTIDELGIWNRVLSAGEVTELYALGHGDSYPF